MSLSSLSAYIDKHHHLPEIKSVDEVLDAGSVDISELQIQLLKKVEELTLYTLQQEEKISKLETLIIELQSHEK